MSLVLAQIGFGFTMFLVVSGFFWYGLQKYPRSGKGFAIGVLPSIAAGIVLEAISYFLLPPAWSNRLFFAESVGLVLAVFILAILSRIAGDEDG